MLPFLRRLDRSVRWTLLSPPSCLPSGVAVQAREDVLPRLALLQRARAEAFGLSDLQLDVQGRASDLAATHLVAYDASGAVAGSARLFLVDRMQERLTAQLIAGFGRIRFADEATAIQQLHGLDAWLDAQPVEARFVYAGGFFSAPTWRTSGLAAALGMGAIAWARMHGSRMSVSFASVVRSQAKFFSMLGARPLPSADGQPLPTFTDSGYGIELRIVHFDSVRPDPEIEPGAEAMQARLATLTALAMPGDATALPPHGDLRRAA